MIAKAIKGKGFRGALEYDLKKEQGRIIDTNMDGCGPRELAAEFGEIRKLRPNLGKALLHARWGVRLTLRHELGNTDRQVRKTSG